ncbi:hypothetical protein Purlil1_14055 [Purpureocillium lilacinum]|uniref:Arsenical-resistance protein n=1 Tax=Purpureocillium lilacinum TaxID=33203 RepID=A0ABR0BCF1_PURLI|nr:hypothetical protein Purlil1_14055 [Purpureocillium lilacinum]
MSAEPKSSDVTASSPAQQPDVASATTQDLEGQVDRDGNSKEDTVSAFKALGWLDRFLALWIFLSMAIGIILGNFVPSTGPALQKGKFVGVSVPIVAVNSILQMVLFAPLAVFFIRVISGETGVRDISYEVVAISVGVFLGIPLAAAIMTRFTLRMTAGPAWYERVFLRFASPWSLIGLLYTIIVLFASQGRQVVHQVVSVIRVAAPLVVYFISIFCVTLFITYRLGFKYPLAVTQSFTASSNNFELAIAVAVATFGPDSDQALASTVGPLIEVPVLLGLVYLMRFMRKRWEWKA